ncbi:MAG: hypothetical protein CMJ59_09755 [Planctomycetaceae bacterium]|nr:hypothetical protein [Planctomycetaceae bacterium]
MGEARCTHRRGFGNHLDRSFRRSRPDLIGLPGWFGVMRGWHAVPDRCPGVGLPSCVLQEVVRDTAAMF